MRNGVAGYVKGYNRYLAKTGVENIPDPRCAGAEWVRPITEIDVYRRFYELALYASGGVAISGIANAQPPSGGASPQAFQRAQAAAETITPAERAGVEQLGEALDFGEDTGSNAWGLGSDATKSGGGIVLGNPHFPWSGPRRFYQSHLKIPGKLNVSGASLFGVPIVLIGHTAKLAWSHTVSTAFRFTPYELELDPADPTRYMVGGESVPMETDQVTVEVRQPDGSIAPQTRTMYSTRYGQITTSIQGQELFALDRQHRVRVLGRQRPELRAAAQPLPRNEPGAVDARAARDPAHLRGDPVGEHDRRRRARGAPCTPTSARSPTCPTRRRPAARAPSARSPSRPSGCRRSTARARSARPSRPPDALSPGIFGSSSLPSLERRDYVANGNDSYWLTNAEQPLEGFPRIIGDERTERSLRTRLGLKMIEQRLAGTDGLRGDRFTRNQVRRLVFQNRHYGGELWRDELVAYCNANPTMVGSNGPVDVSEACAALAGWDLRVNNDSTGALLFARFMTHFGGGFAQPFDVNDPVNTPFGLDTEDVDVALADAVSDLRAANIPLDAPYGDHHYELARQRGDPDPRRRGRPGRLQRDLRRLDGRRRLQRHHRRLELRHGHLVRGRLSARPLDPHLLALGEPELGVLCRPDADVLREEVGQPAVLREAGRGGRRERQGAAGKVGARGRRGLDRVPGGG